MKDLYAAMAKAFPEIEGASKDKNNPHFKSKYADLGAVVEAIKPALTRHGLFFVQQTHEQEGGVCVETVVCHSSGESMPFGKLFVPASKQDAQGYGSALTYARRYSLMTAFGVCPEDDDGNAASKPANDASAPSERALKQKLDGPHTSKTALQSAIRTVVHEVNGCGDLDQLEGYLSTDEAKATIEQCKRDMPNWFNGWPEQPDNFTPLGDLIASRRLELATPDFIQQQAANLRAG